MPILIPCPGCSGTGTDTHEDRHAETRQDVCCVCGGTRTVPSQTGETRAGSFDPATGRAFGDEADDEEDREVRVYPVDGEFVVAEGGMWLPGSYATEAGARRAAEGFTYEALHALQDWKNAEAGGAGGTITDADLDALAAATAAA